MKANLKADFNKDKSPQKKKDERQLKNNKLKHSSYLIAKIEQERDYFHTCIYSRY